MKNMYLAAAMAVSLAFTACSDDESGKADRAYNPIEILGTINDATDVQNTRAVGSNWGVDDRIGVTVDGPTSVMQSILISIFSIVKTMAMHSVL